MVIRLAGELQAKAFLLNERRVPGLYPKRSMGLCPMALTL
jgi:hypothetical protein